MILLSRLWLSRLWLVITFSIFKDISCILLYNNDNYSVVLSYFSIGSLHYKEFNDIDMLHDFLNEAVSLNITTLDTADVYGWYEDGKGVSNDLLSQVFQRYPDMRKKFKIIAKFGIRLENGYHVDLSPSWIWSSINRYLDLFFTSYIDVFMIHNPTNNMNYIEIANTFFTLYKQKKVLFFGVSNFEKWQWISLQEAMNSFGISLSIVELEASVLHYEHLMEWNDFSIENNIPILGWGPEGGDPNGGKNRLFLSNGEREKRIVSALQKIGKKYDIQDDQVTISWIHSFSSLIIPILGTTRKDRLKNQSIPYPLDEQDIAWLSSQLY
ncbi:MAG: hypothetical protein EBZ74_12200 [Planctomycetia bacterium]|nr:hypothetical protein [Planctomycetia bacterium]